MVRRDAGYGGPSTGSNTSRGYNHDRHNVIYNTDMERDGGHSTYERARGDYDDPDGAELRRAMYNADRRELRHGSAAGARDGRSGEAHGGAHGNPYHGVEAFPSDDDYPNDPEHAPPGVTRFHDRPGEGTRRGEPRSGARWGHGTGGRHGMIDTRDSFHAPDARFSRDGMMNRSHHHHGYDERAGQDLSDDDDPSYSSDDARMRADSENERLEAYSAGIMRAEARRAAAGHGDRYGGPSRRY